MKVITPASSLTHVFWTRIPSTANVLAYLDGAKGKTQVSVSRNAVFATVRVPATLTVADNLPATIELHVNGKITHVETFRAPVTIGAGTPGPKGDKGDKGNDSTVPGPKGDKGDDAPPSIGLITGRLTAPVTTPIRTVAYVANSADVDIFAIAYDPNNTNDGNQTRWTSWFNERGLFRLQQSNDAKWDVPLRLFGPADNTGFGSDIIQVHRRRTASGVTPVHVFGVDASGRLKTSLYEWQNISLNSTKFSNDSSGSYDNAQVRRLSDDTLELRGGRVVVSTQAMAVGDVIGTLPANFRPAKRKVITVVNATGGVAPCFVEPDGTITNQRALGSGVIWLSLDGIKLY